MNVVANVGRFGFCIVEPSGMVTLEPSLLLSQFAEAVGLGNPFVPEHYAGYSGFYDAWGFSRICAGAREAAVHRGFSSRVQQALHVDNTLGILGSTGTTVLHCVSRASFGGESQLFNAVGAFLLLRREHPELANALLHPFALARFNRLSSSSVSYGPAFGIRSGRWVTRFSVDNTSEWNEEAVPLLGEALEFLKQLAIVGTGFFLEGVLYEGETLVIANDTLAHGRTAYLDNERKQRYLLRGLYQASLLDEV